jgi:diadenylate cyclase
MAFFQPMVPFIEIAIISILLNYLLSFFWHTKSMDLVWGFFAFILLFALSGWFQLPVLQKIMFLIANTAMIAVLIIFQPELRVALSKLSLKGKRYKEITEFDKFLEALTNSTFRLAEKKTGALIVLENEDSLEEYAQKAVMLHANFSSELLETIFASNTPLHDGALLIRGRTLIAAGAILPLSEDSSQLSKSMGTRHRAALGLSHATDALVIVISEESGRVSIARDGIMTRGVKSDRFRGIIRSIFNPPDRVPVPSKLHMWWFKQ